MSSFSTNIAEGTSPQSNPNKRLSHPAYTRILQNFRLVWLDVALDDVNENDFRENIVRLRRTINTIDTFTDIDQCIQFIGDIKDEMVFLVVTGYVGQHILPIIHDMIKRDSIYILCGSAFSHKQWIKQWPKIKGTFTKISSICDALRQNAQQCDQNYISIGFLSANDDPSTQNLDQLDPSFMYSQILKDILLTIQFDESHLKEFIDYCRKNISSDAAGIWIIDQMDRSYDEHTPIWWYTAESFLYSVLHRALREMEVDIIIKMGFYVNDLHRQIEKLHVEQYGGHSHSDRFIVYRGQGLPINDFDRMQQMGGGLIAFNNFLSTSTDQQVPLSFASQALSKPNTIGIIFHITVDPSISSTPFADIGDLGHFQQEKEILFSMHAVFRINRIRKLETDDRIWQITLTMTEDNDKKLLTLTERMRAEAKGYTGWYELAMLLLKLAEYQKAEQLLELLRQQTSNWEEETLIHRLLGISKTRQEEYSKALSFYEKSLAIRQESLPANHPISGTSLSNIGEVYSNKKLVNYSIIEQIMICVYLEKDLVIRQVK